MTYTMLGMPALGFDLVRSGDGAATAELLILGLGVTQADLLRLAGAHPGRVRRTRWSALVAAGGSMHAAVTDLRDTGVTPNHVLLRQLEQATLGSVEALDRFIRRDLLNWTWHGSDSDDVASQNYLGSLAADVLSDATAAHYCGTALDASLRDQLLAPLAESGVTTRAETMTLPEPTMLVLEQLSQLSGRQISALRSAVQRTGNPTGWAPAMHQVSWALELTGRHRVAALAQLRAVQAFQRSGLTARDGAYGVWNCVSGVVAASVVEDLLPDREARTLTADWRSVTAERV